MSPALFPHELENPTEFVTTRNGNLLRTGQINGVHVEEERVIDKYAQLESAMRGNAIDLLEAK